MTQAEKKRTMNEQIKKHGEKVNAIFNTGLDPVKLSKKLFQLENKAHRLNEQVCNGDLDREAANAELTKIESKVFDLLSGNSKVAQSFFINGDPRGCALKIDDEAMRDFNLDLPRDWGGFGLLAPDFS